MNNERSAIQSSEKIWCQFGEIEYLDSPVDFSNPSISPAVCASKFYICMNDGDVNKTYFRRDEPFRYSFLFAYAIRRSFDLHCIDWTTIVCSESTWKTFTIKCTHDMAIGTLFIVIINLKWRVETRNCLKRKLLLFKWSIAFCDLAIIYLFIFFVNVVRSTSLWPQSDWTG